jgi:hypothetical protein
LRKDVDSSEEENKDAEHILDGIDVGTWNDTGN